jgi:hypothetical protein
MRLREAVSEMQLRRMTATLFFGPAYVLEMPKDDIALDPVMLDPIGHYGLNFGFDAEIPIAGGKVSLQGGMEDFFTWWNADTWAARNDRAYANDGFNTVSIVEVNPSHMLLLRAGVSVKF